MMSIGDMIDEEALEALIVKDTAGMYAIIHTTLLRFGDTNVRSFNSGHMLKNQALLPFNLSTLFFQSCLPNWFQMACNLCQH